MFLLWLQFEPELPEEEEDEPEEACEDAVQGEEHLAAPEDEDAAAVLPPPPTGARARDRPPTRRSRFWGENEDPLSKGLPYTGRPL